MCGIACYLGNNKEEGLAFGTRAGIMLRHRGPDDNGIFTDNGVTLSQTRLSILELSAKGHQPMTSSCGRYVIIFNGEIYNHLTLRKQFLPNYSFRGHSDTETVIELFREQGEKMLGHMVGMWAIIIWDKEQKKIFISRDRYGQKPLYMKQGPTGWYLASEIKPLLGEGKCAALDPTALVEYLALGNYGHLGAHTFFHDIRQFPEGCYGWLGKGEPKINTHNYWQLPDIKDKDKVPFDKTVQKGLHDRIVEAVLSQTLSDVPIGVTLSGGIDSSIIAGILATYYDKEINLFTAQSSESKYDETRYVDAVIAKYGRHKFRIHTSNLNELSIRNNIEKYIRIQEEPFGDPSIIAHGFLMQMSADAGVKVILNGQGADELFFGYNNMTQAVLSNQLKSLRLGKFAGNLGALKLGNGFFMRVLLESFFPNLEYSLRTKSRIKRRSILRHELSASADNDLVSLYKYNRTYNVWRESVYGVHIPHLVHYDDRNAMAYSIEGRMPFLDHRIAEYVATIRPCDFLENGRRKYILRESCRQYLPEIIYNRTDKIGFYTPLIHSLENDRQWIAGELAGNMVLTESHTRELQQKLKTGNLGINDALHIWRCVSVKIWMQEFGVKYPAGNGKG